MSLISAAYMKDLKEGNQKENLALSLEMEAGFSWMFWTDKKSELSGLEQQAKVLERKILCFIKQNPCCYI